MWRTALVGSPESWLRILVVAPLAYAALIAILRMSGKRTLAKMNAFDVVVTVSIGSLLASGCCQVNPVAHVFGRWTA
jgi:uncharacterized membrane protein YcaP (DUF421 family)